MPELGSLLLRKYYRCQRCVALSYDLENQLDIPFMIKLLNKYQKETIESFKKLQKMQKSHTIVPVNHVCTSPYPKFTHFE